MVNKRKLVNKMAKKSQLSEEQMNLALTALFEIIKSELANNNKVSIRNFGSFEIVYKKEKIWTNPYTKETSILSAHKSVKWKASSNLLTSI